MQPSFSQDTIYQLLKRHLLVGLAIFGVAIGLLATTPAEAVVTQPQVTNIWHGSLQVGKELFVGLPERSASTGYHWISDPVPAGLTLSEEMFYPKNRALGSPAVRGYTIKVVSCPQVSCNYELHFQELPPGSARPVSVVDVHLTVAPKGHPEIISSHLEVGQKLFVGLLDRSASTGYHWIPDSVPAGLALSEEMYYPRNPAPGSPAVRGYTINVESCAAGSCSYAMNFNLVPPGHTAAFQIVEVKIVAEPSPPWPRS